ncbi:hypothetical protein Trydic_g7075 [Trypoxylus dichotomus]
MGGRRQDADEVGARVREKPKKDGVSRSVRMRTRARTSWSKKFYSASSPTFQVNERPSPTVTESAIAFSVSLLIIRLGSALRWFGFPGPCTPLDSNELKIYSGNNVNIGETQFNSIPDWPYAFRTLK